MIQVSPRTQQIRQIFTHPHLEELIDNIHQVMIRIRKALPVDYGTSHQYLDEEEPNNDEEGKAKDNVNTQEMGDTHEGIFLKLYASDSENEDELEDIDGSIIIINVHVRCTSRTNGQ